MELSLTISLKDKEFKDLLKPKSNPLGVAFFILKITAKLAKRSVMTAKLK